jgi:ribose 5-phosphate isomerase B
MRIAVGGDHAGYVLKTAVAKHLVGMGHEVVDFGTDSEQPVDYPAYCAAVGRAVVSGQVELGIVLGGSGQGEAIASNKIRGVRAALCQSEFMARLARRHNDANVLSLGGRVLGEPFAIAIVDEFLKTEFEAGGRHSRRVQQIAELEVNSLGEKKTEEADHE